MVNKESMKGTTDKSGKEMRKHCSCKGTKSK